MLQARANPDKKAWGGVQGAPTALQQASENGHLQIVRLLVDAGADKDPEHAFTSVLHSKTLVSFVHLAPPSKSWKL